MFAQFENMGDGQLGLIKPLDELIELAKSKDHAKHSA